MLGDNYKSDGIISEEKFFVELEEKKIRNCKELFSSGLKSRDFSSNRKKSNKKIQLKRTFENIIRKNSSFFSSEEIFDTLCFYDMFSTEYYENMTDRESFLSDIPNCTELLVEELGFETFFEVFDFYLNYENNRKIFGYSKINEIIRSFREMSKAYPFISGKSLKELIELFIIEKL